MGKCRLPPPLPGGVGGRAGHRLQGWGLQWGLRAGLGAPGCRELLVPLRAVFLPMTFCNWSVPEEAVTAVGVGVGGRAPKPKRQSCAPKPPPPHGTCYGTAGMVWRHPQPHVSQRCWCHMRRSVAPGRKGVRRRVQPGFKSPSWDRLVSALALSHPADPMAPAVPLALLAVGLGLGLALPSCDYPTHLWCSSREIAVACQVRAAGPGLVPSVGTQLLLLVLYEAGAGARGAAAAHSAHTRCWDPVHVLALSIAPARCRDARDPTSSGTPRHTWGRAVLQPDLLPSPGSVVTSFSARSSFAAHSAMNRSGWWHC